MKGEFWKNSCYGRESDVMIFVRFLKEHGVFIPYLNALNIDKKYMNNVAWRKNGTCTLFSYPAGEWINYAFSWRSTPEGETFWAKLSRDWRIYCYENRLE